MFAERTTSLQGSNNPTVGSCLILTYSQVNSHHLPFKNPVKKMSESNFHTIQKFKGICTKNTIVGFSRHKQQWMNERMKEWKRGVGAYRMTTSYLLIMFPKELFLMAKPLPMTTQVLHSRLLTKATQTQPPRATCVSNQVRGMFPPIKWHEGWKQRRRNGCSLFNVGWNLIICNDGENL